MLPLGPGPRRFPPRGGRPFPFVSTKLAAGSDKIGAIFRGKGTGISEKSGGVDPAFESAWLLYYWAYTHAKKLESEVKRAAANPDLQPVPTVTAQYEAKLHGFRIILTGLDRLPPPRWGLIQSDVAVTLRACLDHVAWAVVGRGSRVPLTDKQARNVYFPIADSPERFRQLAPGNLPGVTGADLARIRRHQPYKRGKRRIDGDPLILLARLVNDNKHRTVQPVVLLPVAAAYEITQARDCVPGGLRRPKGLPRLEVGAELSRIAARKTGPNPHLEVKLHPTLDIGIYRIPPVTVGTWLNDTLRVTAAILEQFSSPPQVAQDLVKTPI